MSKHKGILGVVEKVSLDGVTVSINTMPIPIINRNFIYDDIDKELIKEGFNRNLLNRKLDNKKSAYFKLKF
jgi:hypothetical protein